MFHDTPGWNKKHVLALNLEKNGIDTSVILKEASQTPFI